MVALKNISLRVKGLEEAASRRLLPSQRSLPTTLKAISITFSDSLVLKTDCGMFRFIPFIRLMARHQKENQKIQGQCYLVQGRCRFPMTGIKRLNHCLQAREDSDNGNKNNTFIHTQLFPGLNYLRELMPSHIRHNQPTIDFLSFLRYSGHPAWSMDIRSIKTN